MTDITVAGAIVNGLFGAAGMLVGGLIVYSRVEAMIRELKQEIAGVRTEAKASVEALWESMNDLQPREVCVAEKKTCMVQFQVFKEGQQEIKIMFNDLRSDFKSELKLLRECIAAATSGKC